MSDPDNPDKSNIYSEVVSGLDYLHVIEHALHCGLNELQTVDKVGIGNSRICCIPDNKILSDEKDDFVSYEAIL